MTIYVKPCGKEIDINENAFEYAKSLKWEVKEAPKKTVKKSTKSKD